jgi:hypothetical protein
MKPSIILAFCFCFVFGTTTALAEDCSFPWARFAQSLIQGGLMSQQGGVTPKGCQSLMSTGQQINQSCPYDQARQMAERNLAVANQQYENCKRMFPTKYGVTCAMQVGMCGKATNILVLINHVSIWSNSCQRK